MGALRSVRARRAVPGVVALGLVALATAGLPSASASTPPTQSATVPTSGTTVVSWTGTIPAGTNPTSDCSTTGGATADSHGIALTVPAGVYSGSGTATTAVFSIAWTPASPSATTSDEAITVLGPDGSVIGSGDTSANSETVSTSNPAAGTYTVEACGYVNTTPQDYTGTLRLTTAATGAPTVAAPPATTQAIITPTTLKFSHEVYVDHQRDGFEPDIVPAHGADGAVYTSVPSGSSTTTSFIWQSLDHGNSYQFVPGNIGTGRPTTCPQGGGDTELQVDSVNNLYFSDLQNLSNLTNGVSTDNGATFLSSCASVPNTPVDRMWYAIDGTPASTPGTGVVYEEYDAVLSTVNPAAGNELVAVASNNGVEFTPVLDTDVANCLGLGVANCVSTNEGIPGNMVIGNAASAAPGKLFIAHTTSDSEGVAVSIGTVSGTYPALQATWQDVTVNTKICPDYDATDTSNEGKSQMCGAAEFATIAQDDAGNLYVCFASHQETVQDGAVNQTGPYQVFVVSSKDGGASWSDPVQITHDGTNAFSWVTAGSDGRVAAAWYASNEASEGGSYVLDDLKHAEFSTQVGMSLDAASATPHYQIATVSEHPIKFGSICTAGLGCTLNGGDRSLGDYLEVGHDDSGRLYESFVDDTSNVTTAPTNPSGDFADNGPPVVSRQIAGPSLYASTGSFSGPGGGPGVPLDTVTDPAGDSVLPALSQRLAAGDNLDLLGSTVGRDADGLVVTMKLKDLSSLQPAPTAGGTTGEWVTRFTVYTPGVPGNGAIYYAAMESIAGGPPTFTAGKPEAAMQPASLQVNFAYDSTTAVPGSYDPATGTITIHVPFKAIDGHGTGTTLYSVQSFTASTVGTLQGNPEGIFSVTDQTTPYNTVVPVAATPVTPVVGPGGTPQSGSGGSGATSGTGSRVTSGRATLARTGLTAAVPALALLLLVGAGVARRRVGRHRETPTD